MPGNTHDRIIEALLSLKDNPLPRNAKKLHGREGMRLRVGNYRVLYIVDDAKKELRSFLSPIEKRSIDNSRQQCDS